MKKEKDDELSLNNSYLERIKLKEYKRGFFEGYQKGYRDSTDDEKIIKQIIERKNEKRKE